MAKGSLRVNGIIVDTDGEITASTGDSIVIREDDGSAVITVDTSGNVGINTTAPGAQFDIRGPAGTGSASASVLRMSTAETSVVDADQLGRIEFIAPLEAGGTDAILVGASIHAEADDTFAADNNATELVFSTGASEAAAEKMRIDSAGRVGIGTSAPKSDALLHVKTSTDSVNLLVESTEAGAAISGFGINMYRNSASAADNDNIAALRYIGKNDAGSPEDVTYGTMYGQIIDASDGTEDGALHIQTMKAGALTTTISVNAGNVLIGGITTAESVIGVTPKVQIEGLNYADSSLSLFNNSNNGNGAYLYIGKSRGTSLNSDTIVQDGDFVGGINFVAADGVDRQSRIAGIFAAIDGTPGADDTPGELTFYTTADGANSLGSADMVIKTNGNVGIGSTSPSSTFRTSINGDGSSIIGGIEFRNAASGGSTFTVGMASATSPSGKINVVSAGNLILQTNDTERMRIDSSGKVGIGTATPSFPTDIVGTGVVGSGSGGGVLRLLDTADYNATKYTGISFANKYHSNGAIADMCSILGVKENASDNNYAGVLTFHTRANGGNGTEKMRIDSAGRVGIGTTAPDSNALLHIHTSLNSANLLIESTEAGASTSGFGINLYRNSASAADNDVMSNIRFIGKNDAGSPEDVTYAQMYAQIVDASDGTEDGDLFFQTMASGTLSHSFAAYADGLYFPQGGHYMLGGAKMLSGSTDIAFLGHSYMYTVYFGRWSSTSDYHFSKRVISASYGDGSNTSAPWTTHSIGSQSIATSYDNSGYKLKANPSASAGTFYFLLAGNGYSKPYLL